MLTIVHNNPVSLQDGGMRVDRKFHDGMLNYVSHIRAPITTVHPLAQPGESVMDPVELRVDELPYQVLGLRVDHRSVPDEASQNALHGLIQASQVVVGYGYGSSKMALAHRKRMIVCLEYDLQTQLIVSRSWAKTPWRGWVNMASCYRDWRRDMVPAMRHAWEVHCNGFPIYHAAAPFNAKRLLYFDSRMAGPMVMSPESLETRLQSLDGARPVRMMFSGRYERMKGALDAVQAAAACLERGLNVEMDTYGQGSQAAAMRAVAAQSNGRIRVHDAIPFPDLVKKTHAADLFLCCHIQSDPSCTYLESMGAGLPIVGYANRMWTSMAELSRAGVVTPVNTPGAVADAVQAMLGTPTALADASRRARQFASEHAFETEFRRRTDAINAALELA